MIRLLIISLIFLCSCKSYYLNKYCVGNVYKEEVRDTVIKADTAYLEAHCKGDTIIVDKIVNGQKVSVNASINRNSMKVEALKPIENFLTIEKTTIRTNIKREVPNWMWYLLITSLVANIVLLIKQYI